MYYDLGLLVIVLVLVSKLFHFCRRGYRGQGDADISATFTLLGICFGAVALASLALRLPDYWSAWSTGTLRGVFCLLLGLVSARLLSRSSSKRALQWRKLQSVRVHVH